MPKSGAKHGWTPVVFGDVVQLSRERSKDPEEDGFECYVGLEHIEPGDLKIRRWGDIADGTTFTNVFRSGQVLFGKRRAYQRKVAVADFDGVCSGDIYVLEPKNERLLPELLPYICQTEGFFEHAVGTSAGSLSPRTNWDSLASYEFALPPLEEQRRISAVLAAASDYTQKLTTTIERADKTEAALFYSVLTGRAFRKAESADTASFGAVRSEWPLVKISDVAHVAYGISAAVSDNEDPSIGWPILTGANITLAGEIDLHKLVYHPAPTKKEFVLQGGDVLLNWRSGSQAHVGKAALFQLEGNWTFASFILRVRAGEDLNSFYLWRLLNYMRRYQLFGTSTSQQVNFKMNAAYFREVKIPCPPRRIQDRLAEQLQATWEARAALERRRAGASDIGRWAMGGG